MAEQASVEDRLSAFLQAEEPEEAVAPTEPAAEPEAVAEEVPEDAVEETEEQEVVEEESTDDDAIEVSSLGELAEHLGIEVADLYALHIPVTDADGKKVDVSLGEWKDSFQSSKIYAKQQSELQQERERFAQERSKIEADLKQQRTVAENFIKTAETALLGDIERIDWNALREADPAEFSAKRQEMLERQQTLERAKVDLQQQVQAAEREHAEKYQQQRTELMAREQAALLEAFPAWKDPKVAQAEWARAEGVLAELGFKPQEIAEAIDHRIYRLAMLAADGKAVKDKANVAKKRVLKIGKKVLKPGAKASKGDAQAEAYRSQRAKLRKSGNPRDAVELIKGLL